MQNCDVPQQAVNRGAERKADQNNKQLILGVAIKVRRKEDGSH